MTVRFEIVVWYKCELEYADLPRRIINQLGRSPDEGTEIEGVGDLHWKFETLEAATESAESLFELAASKGLIRLIINGYGSNEFERRVYKDNVRSAQKSEA